jgi:diguanylate cyclase (GGDEF)-like protein/PAS domain S-box-containing protein
MRHLENPEIYRQILEDLPTGVYLVGRDGKILFWNYGAERITGHLRQDVVGHACREDFLGGPEGNADQGLGAAAALEAVLRDGKATESQVSFRHKSGHLIPVKLRAAPLRDPEGKIIGAVESFDEMMDVAAWDRRHNKLAEYGCLDDASGVLNHKMVESRLRECLGTLAETKVPFDVVVISFDHLDEMKTRYGPGAITAALRTAGQTLENSLRPTDFLGRWKENEFIAIVTECNRAELPNVVERLKRTIGRAKITWWGDALPLTATMGATAAKEEDTVQGIVRRAEGALSEGIEKGGNQIVVKDE